MPGYVIHLAIGKVYEQKNKIEDIESFERGIIAPDKVKDKKRTHYGPCSSQPGLNRYLKEHGILNEFDEGYFLHLASDYLFYNKLLKSWDKRLYEDYDILNNRIIEKYGIIIPEEIKEIIKPKIGKLNILNEKEINNFIQIVGSINIRQIIKNTELDFEKQINRIDFKIE